MEEEIFNLLDTDIIKFILMKTTPFCLQTIVADIQKWVWQEGHEYV